MAAWTAIINGGSLILSRNRSKDGEEGGGGGEGGDGVERESDRLHFVSKQSLISGRQVPKTTNYPPFPIIF
jgi:hypothetical protein